MQQVENYGIFIEYDADTDTWSVEERTKRRKMEPRGFVFEEEPGKWASSRHTYSGVPARHGEGFTTKEAAALSLSGAQPFRGTEYNHPSLEYDQETGGRVTPFGTVEGV